MKNLLFLISLLFLTLFCEAEGIDTLNYDISNTVHSCTCKGKNLWGRVKVVSSGADIVVKVTDSNVTYDLAVKKVDTERQANECGKWYFTDSNIFYDFTVQFTNSNVTYDLVIKYTDSNVFYGTK